LFWVYLLVTCLIFCLAEHGLAHGLAFGFRGRIAIRDRATRAGLLGRTLGEPDPECTRRNALVVRHTLERRSVGFEGPADDPGDDVESDSSAIQQFLALWNGDWSRPIVSHVCNGCCANEAEAKANLFAAAIGVDILQSRDCDVPSQDDWGSCGAATGRTSLGLLCHDLLQRVFAEALPDWNAMCPGGPSDDEDADRRKLRIQKKVCFLMSPFIQPIDRSINWTKRCVRFWVLAIFLFGVEFHTRQPIAAPKPRVLGDRFFGRAHLPFPKRRRLCCKKFHSHIRFVFCV